MTNESTYPSDDINSVKFSIRFGIADTKGRDIGANVMTYELDFSVSDDQSRGWLVAPGHYFCARVHATRNGVNYGACQHAQRFTTAEARDAYVAKYLDQAKKRASKK